MVTHHTIAVMIPSKYHDGGASIHIATTLFAKPVFTPSGILLRSGVLPGRRCCVLSLNDPEYIKTVAFPTTEILWLVACKLFGKGPAPTPNC